MSTSQNSQNSHDLNDLNHLNHLCLYAKYLDVDIYIPQQSLSRIDNTAATNQTQNPNQNQHKNILNTQNILNSSKIINIHPKDLTHHLKALEHYTQSSFSSDFLQEIIEKALQNIQIQLAQQPINDINNINDINQQTILLKKEIFKLLAMH